MDKNNRTNKKTPSTSDDKKIQASVYLKGVSSRLEDCGEEINNIHKIFPSNENLNLRFVKGPTLQLRFMNGK